MTWTRAGEANIIKNILEEYGQTKNHKIYATKQHNHLPNNKIFDSGATMHVTRDKDVLSNTTNGSKLQIITASDRALLVAVPRVVNLPSNRSIYNVLYARGICKICFLLVN